MFKKYLVLLLILFGFSTQLSWAVLEDQKVILFLNLHDVALEPHFDFDDAEIQEISKKYPERQIRKVNATSIQDLKDRLDSILNKNELISHLILSAHGARTENAMTLQVGASDAITIGIMGQFG